MLERSISRIRELEAVLASPSCPCSSDSTFALPLPGSSAAAAPDTGTNGDYSGIDQYTLAKKSAAAAAAVEAARILALEKEQAEAEVKRIQSAKQLARATCTHTYVSTLLLHFLT